MYDILICGDRNWRHDNYYPMLPVFSNSGDIPLRVISGGATGADFVAHTLAEIATHTTSIQYFADWSQYGRAAGPIRNRLQYDSNNIVAVFAFHESIQASKRTRDMVTYAIDQGCPNIFLISPEGNLYFSQVGPEYSTTWIWNIVREWPYSMDPYDVYGYSYRIEDGKLLHQLNKELQSDESPMD